MSPVITTEANQHKFTKHYVILCKMFSNANRNVRESWGYVCSLNDPTRKRYQSINMLTEMAFPQPDSSLTAHQSMSWPEIHYIFCADHAMLKKALYPSRSCLGNENSVKNGEGHMWEWCEIMKINTKFIK